MAVPRCVALLDAQGIAFQVDIVLIAHRLLADQRTERLTGGVVLLVQHQLVCGEVVRPARERRKAQVPSGAALELDGLLRIVRRPIRLNRLGPMLPIDTRLDLHLGDVAIAGVLARNIHKVFELVHHAVIDRHGDVQARNVSGMEHGLLIVVEGEAERAPVVAAAPVDSEFVAALGRRQRVTPRILERRRRDFLAPRGEALLVARANLIRVRRVIRQASMVEFGHIANSVQRSIDKKLVARCTVNLVPGELDARGGLVLLGGFQLGRSLEILLQRVAAELGIVREALDHKHLFMLLHIGFRQEHVDLRGSGDLLLAELLALRSGIQVGCLLVVPHGIRALARILCLVEGRLVIDLLNLLATIGDRGRRGGHVHHGGSGTLRVVPGVSALGLADGQRCGIPFDLRGDLGRNMVAVGDILNHAIAFDVLLIGIDGLTVVLEQRVLRVAGRPELDDATSLVEALLIGLADCLRVVVLLIHGDDGARLDEQRKLPQRRFEIVENLSATILLAGEVIDPDGRVLLIHRAIFGLVVIGQVDAVADVITGIVRIGRVLVHRRDQEVLAEGVLILRVRPARELRIVREHHRADHGQAGIAILRIDVRRRRRTRVDIRHELSLELQIHARNTRVRIAVSHRALAMSAPAVHVEHGGGEGLPLVIASRDDGSATKDAVHVGADVGVTRKTLTDVRGEMEANVLPVATCLVAGPDAAIALRSRPAVERDDIGTHAVGELVIRRNVICLLDTVQAERITRSNPSDVSLEGRNTALLNLLLEVALQMPLLVIHRLEV